MKVLVKVTIYSVTYSFKNGTSEIFFFIIIILKKRSFVEIVSYTMRQA